VIRDYLTPLPGNALRPHLRRADGEPQPSSCRRIYLYARARKEKRQIFGSRVPHRTRRPLISVGNWHSGCFRCRQGVHPSGFLSDISDTLCQKCQTRKANHNHHQAIPASCRGSPALDTVSCSVTASRQIGSARRDRPVGPSAYRYELADAEQQSFMSAVVMNTVSRRPGWRLPPGVTARPPNGYHGGSKQ
jgi:hypothetical protein